MKMPPSVNVNNALTGSMLVEFKVTGVNRAKARIWCAKQLIRLACWIINHDVSFRGNA